MNSYNRTMGALAVITASAMAAGCNSSGSGTGGGTGFFSLAVTDAPVDSAAEVVVTFSAVELKPQSGPSFTIELDPPRSIDLLSMQNGNAAALLDGEEVEAGPYNWLRLHLNAAAGTMDSYILLETGEQYALHVPSGAQTGLQLVRGFTVPVGGDADFTIDFDLRKSVVAPPGLSHYLLRPALRLVDNTEVGVLAGEAPLQRLMEEGCAGGVYVYEGAEPETLGDLGSEHEPLISNTVALDDGGAFSFHFMPAGDYTVAFTCEADLDDPEAGGDALEFEPVTTATVSAGQITTVEFD